MSAYTLALPVAFVQDVAITCKVGACSCNRVDRIACSSLFLDKNTWKQSRCEICKVHIISLGSCRASCRQAKSKSWSYYHLDVSTTSLTREVVLDRHRQIIEDEPVCGRLNTVLPQSQGGCSKEDSDNEDSDILGSIGRLCRIDVGSNRVDKITLARDGLNFLRLNRQAGARRLHVA